MCLMDVRVFSEPPAQHGQVADAAAKKPNAMLGSLKRTVCTIDHV